jgi:hypothetical protein
VRTVTESSSESGKTCRRALRSSCRDTIRWALSCGEYFVSISLVKGLSRRTEVADTTIHSGSTSPQSLIGWTLRIAQACDIDGGT